MTRKHYRTLRYRGYEIVVYMEGDLFIATISGTNHESESEVESFAICRCEDVITQILENQAQTQIIDEIPF